MVHTTEYKTKGATTFPTINPFTSADLKIVVFSVLKTNAMREKLLLMYLYSQIRGVEQISN